jgi:AsmA protein
VKRAIKIAGVLLALLLVVALATPLFLDADEFRPVLQARLSAVLGREVTLGGLKLSVLSGSVTASELSIADDPAFSGSPFLRASTLEAGVELMPLLFSRKLNVTRVAIDQPQIDLVQNAAGVWNFSSIGSKSTASNVAPSSSAASQLSVQVIQVSNGRITLSKAASKAPPLLLDKLNIEVKDYSADSPFTFSLAAAFSGGGGIKLDGKAGPVNAGNAIATPLNANLHITHLDLGLSGAVDPALGLSGIASIEGSILSTGLSAMVSGKLKGEQLKLVKSGLPAKRPLEVDFAVDHDLTKQAGTIKRCDIHLGKAAASLAGFYNTVGEITLLNLALNGSNLDATELGAFLPALDVVLPDGASIEQGTAEVEITAQGPADKLVASGTVRLDGVRLTNFDLGGKLSVLDQMAGIKAGPHTEIQTFHATLRAAPDGTEVEDLELVVPSIGKLTGTGTVSPAHELAFKMRAAIHSVAGDIVDLGSKAGVPFTISGTAQKPSFKADVKDFVEDKVKDLGHIFGGKKTDQKKN